MQPGSFVCDECGLRYDRAGRCAADGRALAETSDPLLGSDLGSYRLVKLLGRGGMGRVYLGVQPAIGGRVAIKVLSEDACEQPDAVARFIAEARAVNLIRHEGIVGVHDFLQLPGGRPAIVMELVDGRTLRDLIELGPLPIGGVVNAMLDVLGALAAAHAIGIIHRDLKPDNVIVTTSGHAKLLDFGIAKLAHGEAGLPRTRTGAVLGTPHYMSPEQIQGEVLDARSDLYSLGVLLFETLTGQRPFERPSDFELMMAHVQAPLPSVRGRRPEIPIEIEQVLECALTKRRADRFRSASAMATALHSASGALPPTAWRSVLDPARVISRAAAVQVLAVGTPARDEPIGRATLRDRRRVLRVEPPRAESPREAPPSRLRTRVKWIAIFSAVAAVGATGTAIALHARAPQATPVTIDVGTHSPDITEVVAPPAHLPTRSWTPGTHMVGGDLQHFDPIAYLPTARQLAQGVVPGAELSTMAARNVHGGITDITRSQAVYLFGAPRSDARATCNAASVVINRGQVSTFIVNSCQPGFVVHCSSAQIWKRAAGQIPDDASVTLNFTRSGFGTGASWVVLASGHPQPVAFADDCGAD